MPFAIREPLELAPTLASLDQRTELIAQDLASLRRDTERGHGELRQDRRLLQSTVTGQMWTLMSMVTVAVLVWGDQTGIFSMTSSLWLKMGFAKRTLLMSDTHPDLYDSDFLAWMQQQAAAIRAGAWDDIDRENLGEEIDSIVRSVVPPADCCSSTDSSSGFSAALAGSSLPAHSGFPAGASWPVHSRRGASRVGVASNTAPSLAPPRGERRVETARGRALGVSGQQIGSFLCRWIEFFIVEVKNP